MEKNNIIPSEQTVSKEYQTPELIDLNSINEAMGTSIAICHNGSTPGSSQCGSGMHATT